MGVDIDFRQFDLKKCYFDHDSILHGVKHTYRVMANTLVLGNLLSADHEKLTAFCGAFIHDMARRHDGQCTLHGRWAVENKVDEFSKLFLATGLHERDIEALCVAVENHSIPVDLPQSHEYYFPGAILKDADALDRIRLGKDNLNTKYLRFGISHKLIPFANDLFYSTEYINIKSFFHLWSIAVMILNQHSIKC